MTTQEALSLSIAINLIIGVTPTEIVIVGQHAAETISQLYLDANEGGGSITGPYILTNPTYPYYAEARAKGTDKVWYVAKH